MPLPRALGVFNRRVTNPILWPIVARLPRSGFGRIVHAGRRSGRQYRTPVLAFAHGERLVVALTYGPATQWAQNVLAAGACDFETRRRTFHLSEPRLFHDPERRFVPPLVRSVLGLLETYDFLELRIVGGDEPPAPPRLRRRPRRAAGGPPLEVDAAPQGGSSPQGEGTSRGDDMPQGGRDLASATRPDVEPHQAGASAGQPGALPDQTGGSAGQTDGSLDTGQPTGRTRIRRKRRGKPPSDA